MRNNIYLFIFTLILNSSLLMGKTLVTVNGHAIDDSIIPKGYEQLNDTQRANLMEHLIKEELIHAELLKSNLVKNAKFKRVFEKQRQLAEKEYKRVSGRELTEAQIRNIKGSIALMLYEQQQFKRAVVTNREVKEFYNENRDKFRFPDSIEIANIIVKSRREAKIIIKKLKRASNLEKEFIKIAREHKQNGYMGWFGKGMAPNNLFNAAYRVKSKTLLSKPIKTKYGYHILYLLNKKRAGKLSFNEIKERIRDMLKKKKVFEALENRINEFYANSEIVYSQCG